MSDLVLSPEQYNATVDAFMGAAGFEEIEAAQQQEARVGRGAGSIIAALAVTGALLVGSADKDASPVRGGAVIEQVMPGVSGFETVDGQIESSDAAETLRMELAHYYENINPNRLVLGAENINWDVRQESRGANSFGFETFKTCFDVAEFLNSDSDASKEAQKYMLRNAANSDIDLNKELERAKKGEGFMAVQSLDQTVLKGTTYLVVGKDGKVHAERAEQRITPEGDVMWVYVTEDGKIIGDFSFRADCNQPGMDKVVPLPEDEEEEIPDVTTSTTSTSTTSTTAPPASTSTTSTSTTSTTAPPASTSTTSTSTTSTTAPPASTSTTSTSTTSTTAPPASTSTTSTTLRQDDGITPGPGSPNTTVPPVNEPATPDNGEPNPVGGTRPTTTTTVRPSTPGTTSTSTTILIPNNGTPTNPNGPFVEQ